MRPHPAVVEAREVIALEREAEEVELRRLYRAIMVAPTLTVCRALLNGERLPIRRLDIEAVNRYGLREIICPRCDRLPDRLTLDDLNEVPDVRLNRRPEGHLGMAANHSKSPSGRTSPRLELVSVRGRQSREA